MNAKELAEKLNGCEIGNETTKKIESIAKENGLVVVFGASDDLIEFRGAIYDEFDCYEGGHIPLNKTGVVINKCDDGECPYHLAKVKKAMKIHAEWCASEEYSWTYSFAIQHEKFDVIKDDGKYCQGIVFSLKDLEI